MIYGRSSPLPPAAVIFFFAGPIAQIFNSEKMNFLQQIAVSGLKLYFTSVVFVGYIIIISTYFTSVWSRQCLAHVVSLLRGLFSSFHGVFLPFLWGIPSMAGLPPELIVMIIDSTFPQKTGDADKKEVGFMRRIITISCEFAAEEENWAGDFPSFSTSPTTTRKS